MFTQAMEKNIAHLIVVTFLVMMMVGSAMAETDNEAFKAIVEEIFNTYASANMNGDADLWISLWDENGVKMVQDKPAIFGKANIGEGKRKSLQNTDIESQIIKVEEAQFAGDWGFARGTYITSSKSKAGGATTNVDGKFLTIFKKQADSSWKIFRDCVISNVAPKGQTCSGTPSSGGRWCDNGDGTVTDMTTGLIWLKNANCGGKKTWDDAVLFASWLHDGWTGDGNGGDCGLSDGSGGPEGYGAWRLPTLSELYELTHGNEAILYSSPGLFSDVQPAGYWSSTTDTNDPDVAQRVCLNTGSVTGYKKTITRYIWPVRSGL